LDIDEEDSFGDLVLAGWVLASPEFVDEESSSMVESRSSDAAEPGMFVS
jgi:hypothetical protein